MDVERIGAIVQIAVIAAATAFMALVGCLWIALRRVEQRLGTALARLAALACPRCGAVVGAKAAADARAQHDERASRFRESARGNLVRLRIDGSWRFARASCDVELKFDPAAARDALEASEG